MGVLLLVRHGQASFGADDYDVLSPTGWEQGRLLGAHLSASGVRPTALVRGSMRRHRETLEALTGAAGWGGLTVTEDAGWDEFDHVDVLARHPDAPDGELDRRAFQLIFEQATRRWTAGRHDADYPETYADFLARVRASLSAAATRAGSGETVVVVTSGGVIAAVAAGLVDPDADRLGTARMWERFNTVTANSAITRVVVGPTGPRLLTFNEHPHLAGAHLTYR
ncbi:histidine phosphatase family protein [Nocardioides pantholopis]|uniref:histidine phosphatase family protein n=1 Tax=Nocardioides pantholopis TaxID=2483798 RepID=UPI000F096E69|nr:phosphoglycerate mutase family protein [Nocardioides pantholopis]